MSRNICLIACCRLFIFAFGFSVAFDAAAVTLDCPLPEAPPSRIGLPFDYRLPPSRHLLETVESRHFTPNVATLQSGNSTNVQGDINYTLNAIPNHHRALQSLADMGLLAGTANIKGLSYSVPCFFIRAAKFTPDDGMVDAVYAYYLARSNQKDMALTMATRAIQKTPKNARVAYTVGLAYFYMDDYKSARDYAKMAKDLGSTAVGLDNLLAGKPNAAAQHK